MAKLAPAKNNGDENGNGIPLNPFVEKLVSDPAAPPRLVRLRGYRGASDKEGCVRLYRTLGVDRWLDIPRERIYHFEREEGDPWRSVVLWIGVVDEATVAPIVECSVDVPADLKERETRWAGSGPSNDPGGGGGDTGPTILIAQPGRP
jgi:hypothetical protein